MGEKWGKMGKKWVRNEITGVQKTVLMHASAGQGGGGEALHYYQGFHDVASVFLLQVGEGTGGLMMERVSLSHMRFATRDTLDSTREVMALLYPLLLLAKRAEACIRTLFSTPVIIFFTHFLPIFPHFSPIFSVWPPGIQEARPEVPGKTGKIEKNRGKWG